MTKDEAQRRPSTLLRAVSPSTLLRTMSLSNGMSNGRWTFYEAVKNEMQIESVAARLQKHSKPARECLETFA
jgi:hypothetical protein